MAATFGKLVLLESLDFELDWDGVWEGREIGVWPGFPQPLGAGRGVCGISFAVSEGLEDSWGDLIGCWVGLIGCWAGLVGSEGLEDGSIGFFSSWGLGTTSVDLVVSEGLDDRAFEGEGVTISWADLLTEANGAGVEVPVETEEPQASSGSPRSSSSSSSAQFRPVWERVTLGTLEMIDEDVDSGTTMVEVVGG